MSTDWKSAQAATHPYQRRRDALAQEHAARSASARAAPLEPPRSSPPFITNPLRTCVCGARPRYGFDEHQKHCRIAQEAAKSAALSEAIAREIADPAPVTAVEGVEAIEATEGALRSDWRETSHQDALDAAAPKVAGKGACPKCGKHFARGLHWHAPRCKGAD